MLNREPAFFKSVRSFHDKHHGFKHKCPASLSVTGRIPELDALNTPQAEQFNSCAKKIRYTGSHLSQSHFMLLMQYFIHINFNTEKDRNIENTTDLVNEINE